MICNAIFSSGGDCRFALTRTWDSGGKRAMFVMLNPSVADNAREDPTSRKAIGFAQRLGFGSLVIVNVYPFIATDSRELHLLTAVAGGESMMRANLGHVRSQTGQCAEIICAWGAYPRMNPRDVDVIMGALLGDDNRKLSALRLNNDGSPGHILYLPYTCKPLRYYGVTRLSGVAG